MILKDQMGREIILQTHPPQRIVSLVPSITELLVYLGLEDKLVGITKFCVHPEHTYRNKEKIGGTKNLNIDKIKKLNPDIIIGNKEENVKEQIELLEKYFPVWMSDVNTYEDALNMIQTIGKIHQVEHLAQTLVDDIEKEFDKLKQANHLLQNKKLIYLIWYKPYIAVANHTFIHHILEKIGAINVLQNKERYVEIDENFLSTLDADYILLSSEPFPFKPIHQEEIKSLIQPHIKVLFVDGELFSWYGVRMKFLPEYLFKLSV